MKRLLFSIVGAAFFLFACGGSGTSDTMNPLMSGQIFIETHSGGNALFARASGVTVEHWSNGIFVESTFTDIYGRFQFQNSMMSNCQIRMDSAFYSINSTYDIDMTGIDEASVYCMVYDSGGQSYAWAHELSDRWSDMPLNFNGGVLDGIDMQNFWQEGSHSWTSYGGRRMFTM